MGAGTLFGMNKRPQGNNKGGDRKRPADDDSGEGRSTARPAPPATSVLRPYAAAQLPNDANLVALVPPAMAATITISAELFGLVMDVVEQPMKRQHDKYEFAVDADIINRLRRLADPYARSHCDDRHAAQRAREQAAKVAVWYTRWADTFDGPLSDNMQKQRELLAEWRSMGMEQPAAYRIMPAAMYAVPDDIEEVPLDF